MTFNTSAAASLRTSTAFGPSGTLHPEPVRSGPAQPARFWRRIDTPRSDRHDEDLGRFLHITEQGVVVRRSGSRILVTKKENILLEVPAIKLQGVLVYGNVQVSTQCARLLLEEKVWISFFSRNGVYRGRLQPPAERGGRLRRQQWRRAEDPAFCLEFAKAVVRGKVLGQKTLATAYTKNYPAHALTTAYASWKESISRVDEARDLAALRGVEGSITRAYFEMFRHWNRSSMIFDARTKHPSPDPVNGLLSLGYTLLTRELEGLLEAAGLDPTIGFYHAGDGDRPSLACDWVEEFRHVVIDRFVLTLVNRGTVRADDFEEPHDRRGIRLKPDALRTFLVNYEQLLSGRCIAGAVRRERPGLRRVMLGQLELLLDTLSGRRPYTTHLEAHTVASHAAETT